MTGPLNDREWVDDHWGTAQRGLPPTERQLEVLVAVILHSTYRAAGMSLHPPIARTTVSDHLCSLMARVGAHNTAHLAFLLYPVLQERMVTNDRRAGVSRRRREAVPLSYHVTGYCAGHLKPEERDRVKEAWTIFVNALEAATDPSDEKFHGFIAGGDWVGSTQARHDEFKLTADDVRDEKKWGTP